MDEILVHELHASSTMLVARPSGYDLWIADEGWEIDYYLARAPGAASGRRTSG